MTATQSQIRDALAELTDYECRPNGAPGNPLALSVAGCRTIRTILQSALDTQPNCIPLCSTQGTTNERVSSGDDQSKVRKVDTQKPAGDAVENICAILLEYDQAEGLRSEQWVWPEHKDDDGYRGDGGYVHIAPTDIQIRYRERANAIMKRALTGDCGGGDFDHRALDALKNHQHQLDMDGIMVGVSRQAVDMAVEFIEKALTADNAKRGE